MIIMRKSVLFCSTLFICAALAGCGAAPDDGNQAQPGNMAITDSSSADSSGSGIETGDRVTFIVDGTNVRVVNSAVYALMRLQEQMKGEAEKAGFMGEEDVAEWITNSRREENMQ